MGIGEGMGEGKGACGACGIKCIKYLLIIFNVVFWLVGLAILAIGIWIAVDPSIKDKLGGGDHLDYLRIGAYVIIGVGAFIALVGFLGCCGAMKESQCMLVTFFILLLLVFCALLAVGIWAVIMRNNIDDVIGDYLEELMKKYNTNDAAKETWNSIQNSAECCGVISSADWVTKGIPIPGSCGTDALLREGCKQVIWDFLKDNAAVVGGVAIGVACIMLLGMIFSCCLCCAIRKGEGEKY